MQFRAASRFRRDVRLAKRRGKDMDKLWAVIGRLAAGEPLEERHRRHRLSGDWSPHWECHIEPDWLLIWNVEGVTLRLVRTGSHSELY